MSAEVPEFKVREESKLTLLEIKNGQLERARQLIRHNKNILSYNFGLPNFLSIIPMVRFSRTIPKNLLALRMLIDTGFEIYSAEDDVKELLFFAAAKCDPEKLSYCLDKLSSSSSDVNQTREGDGVMMFLLKYANPMEKNYEECLKILIKAGVDLNQRDYHARTPASFLVNLYTISMRKEHPNVANLLKTYFRVLMETNQIDTAPLEAEMNEISKDLILNAVNHPTQKTNVEMKDISKWFKFLIEKDENGFIGCKEITNFDLEDGNNTFMQLACEMKLSNVVKYLISRGADLSKVTERNDKYPIEIAARRNSYDIFKSLLDTNKTRIDKKLFVNFLQNRGRQMKTKYFDEILKYNNLDVNIQSSNGNTPLHYAAIFCNSQAVAALLERKASLTVRNDSKKCPLDYMDSQDLENYLNKCIVPEKHAKVNHGKCEIGMDLRSFINNNEESEVDIMTIISNSDKLRHLLNHPLLSNFINIKWQLAYPFFESMFSMHLVLYLVSFLSFSNANFFGVLGWLSVILFSIKTYLFFDWRQNRFQTSNDLVAFVLMFVKCLTGNGNIVGVAITIPLAMSFHMFWRFNPNISEYHARLVNYFTKITALRSYVFTLLSIFFAGFYLSFDQFSVSDVYCILRDKSSTIMFAIFIAFFFIMSLVVIGYALNATRKDNGCDTNFTALGYRYVLYFINCAEQLYTKWGIGKSPLVFVIRTNDKKKYFLKFAVNSNKFSEKNLSHVKLTKARIAELNKFKETYFRAIKNS